MRCAAAIAAAALVLTPPARADETFDVSAYEKKPFEWTGYVEARPEHQWLRQDSAGYLLLYPGESRTTANRLGAAAELSGVLRHEGLSFNFTGHATWLDEPRGTTDDARMYQAYGAWQIDPSSNVEVGKRALRWGKGYAWSPVAFLERPKDPIDPELSREGYVMASGAFVRSFDGPIQTVSVATFVVPTTAGLNDDYGPAGHANWAVKVYGLVYDTDIDLIYAGQGSRGPRFGIDFSRNLGSNLEIHGEWARINDWPQVVLTPENTLAVRTATYDSALIGLRYLTERDTTIIFELYHNGGGYTTDEMSAFYDLVRALPASPTLAPTIARAAAQEGYNRPNVGRHYAYLRVSQKEPFDVLDFTPAFTLVANTDDRSWSLIPEILYTGIRDLELRLRLAFNHGSTFSEYGEKAVRSRIELRARLFF